VAAIPHAQADQIQIIGLTTNDARTVTIAQTRLQSVAWAPDGEHLYVTDFAGARRILLVDFNGKFLTVFTYPDYTWVHFLRPSPDGRYLALTQRTFSSNFAMLENY